MMENKKQNIISCILGFWIVFGVFLDGSAHIAGEVEDFFTPWHAVFYSGYIVNAFWYGFIYIKNKKQMPVGYKLGFVGALVFFIGGISDMIWHEIFGIEEKIKALLSPSHLLLCVGVLLMITSPYRSLKATLSNHKPSFLTLLPATFSLALATAISGFFMMYSWAFRIDDTRPVLVHFYTDHFEGNHEYANYFLSIGQMRGIESIIISTLILLIPAFLLIKRWQVPFGTFTTLYSVLGVLMSVLDRFDYYEQILCLFFVGLLADYLAQKRFLRLFSILVPAITWILYFFSMSLITGIGWEVTLWTGSIVFSILIGIGLFYTVFEKEYG